MYPTTTSYSNLEERLNLSCFPPNVATATQKECVTLNLAKVLPKQPKMTSRSLLSMEHSRTHLKNINITHYFIILLALICSSY